MVNYQPFVVISPLTYAALADTHTLLQVFADILKGGIGYS